MLHRLSGPRRETIARASANIKMFHIGRHRRPVGSHMQLSFTGSCKKYNSFAVLANTNVNYRRPGRRIRILHRLNNNFMLQFATTSRSLICAVIARPSCRAAGGTLYIAFPASGYFLPRTRRRKHRGLAFPSQRTARGKQIIDGS